MYFLQIARYIYFNAVTISSYFIEFMLCSKKGNYNSIMRSPVFYPRCTSRNRTISNPLESFCTCCRYMMEILWRDTLLQAFPVAMHLRVNSRIVIRIDLCLIIISNDVSRRLSPLDIKSCAKLMTYSNLFQEYRND